MQCVDDVVGVRWDSFDRDGSVKLELARCAARNCQSSVSVQALLWRP